MLILDCRCRTVTRLPGFNPLMLANKLYLCATPDWPLSADSRLLVLSVGVSQNIFPSILVWMKNDCVRMDTDDVHMTKANRRILLLLPFFVYSFLGLGVLPDAPSSKI